MRGLNTNYIRRFEKFFNIGAWEKEKSPRLAKALFIRVADSSRDFYIFCPKHASNTLCSDATTSATVRASPWK